MAMKRRSSGDRARARDPRWRAATPAEVHQTGGCYAIFDGTQLVYIGSAVDLRKRLSNQGIIARMPRPHAKLGSIPRPRLKITGSKRWGDWLTREARLIRRLRPPLNSVHAGR